MRERFGTQRLAARRECVGEAAVDDFGETRGAHVDLAVDETLLVTVREPLCSDDTVARSFQMIDRPLRRIFAVGLFAREKQAGVAEALDFPAEAARFGFGVAGHIDRKGGE